jgi:hypothetical protein
MKMKNKNEKKKEEKKEGYNYNTHETYSLVDRTGYMRPVRNIKLFQPPL